MRSILLALLPLFIFTGCITLPFNQDKIIAKNKYYTNNGGNAIGYQLKNTKPTTTRNKNNILQQKISYKRLNDVIVSIGQQLFMSNIKKNNTNIVLTSFADLNKLNKTTTFGRLISESMFRELQIRQFKVVDFRGQNAVSINKTGEFHITRNISKLKNQIKTSEYILVGTYVIFEHNNILINARIIDSETGYIISTARVVYEIEDCSLFNLCPKDIKSINLVKDN